VTLHRLLIAATLLASVLRAAPAVASELPAPAPAATVSDQVPAAIAQAQPAPAPAPPASSDGTAAPASDEPIGNVAALAGTVTVIRNKDSLPLKLRDDIFLNDVVQTAADGSLGITFDDGTTFRLSANARIAIDSYVYQDGGKQNAALFNIGRGTVAFVAAAVAKTGDMKIDTPTATLGIRGTTGLVEVPDDASAAGTNNVAIKLYPDADGRVGHIEVNDRSGARLGALTQGASGFTIRPTLGGGRVAALPLVISAREMQRDQGFVRQVHAAQNVGRQIVTEQRAFRRANPGLNPNRGNPQRPNAAPGRPNQRGQQQQPVTPNSRQGQQQRQQPGAHPQKTLPGQPSRLQNRQDGRRSEQQSGPQQRPGAAQPSALRGRQGLQQRGRPPQTNRQTNQAPSAAPTLPPSPAEIRPAGQRQAAPQLQRPITARPSPQRARPVAPPRGRRKDEPPR
jgi:FecR protein